MAATRLKGQTPREIGVATDRPLRSGVTGSRAADRRCYDTDYEVRSARGPGATEGTATARLTEILMRIRRLPGSLRQPPNALRPDTNTAHKVYCGAMCLALTGDPAYSITAYSCCRRGSRADEANEWGVGGRSFVLETGAINPRCYFEIGAGPRSRGGESPGSTRFGPSAAWHTLLTNLGCFFNSPYIAEARAGRYRISVRRFPVVCHVFA